jgi:putative addiction module CopG family antidote
MEVTLTPEMRAFVDRMVRDGTYGSAADVLRAGLAALMRQERVEELDAGSLEAIYPGLLQKIRGGLDHSLNATGSIGRDIFADYDAGSVPDSRPH